MWNTNTGVVDIDTELIAAAPAADQYTARSRVLDRVRYEVLQQAPQQPPVRAHRERARHKTQFQPLFTGERCKLHVQPLQQFVDAEIGNFRFHRAGVEPRNIQQGSEYL